MWFLLPAIVFAILIARVTSYVRYILPQDRYRNSKMDELKQLLIDKQVPFELKARARVRFLFSDNIPDIAIYYILYNVVLPVSRIVHNTE